MALPPLKIVVPAIVTLSVVATVLVFTLLPFTQVTDLGKDLSFHEKMLDSHLTHVAPDDGKVKFRSDGTLGRVKEPGGRYWLPDFVVAESESFYSWPRRNAYTEFRVHKIETDGVVIEYDAKVMPSRDKVVSVDHGLVRLAWKSGPETFWPYPQ